MASSRELHEPADVLYRIKRGLSAYVSYLAACEMNGSFSEYVLYEPILRILTARGYVVHCEVECPGVPQPKRGDHKKLDFTACKDSMGVSFAMEVKWAKHSKPNLAKDIEKLTGYSQHNPLSHAFICIFGRESFISKIQLPKPEWKEVGNQLIADFGKTRYGCRIYELQTKNMNDPKV